MKQIVSLILVALCYTSSVLAQDSLPNIVLILVDDAALMDFGSYGGEAHTPNIDALTDRGTMFTNYHTSLMCAPSRSMLLTGYDSHLTGVPNLPIFTPPEYAKRPGYQGVLNNQVLTVAERLKTKGYNTYVTGKWHLGHSEDNLPTKRGFDRSYILDASGADNYEHRPYLPTQSSKPPWYKDGELIDLPEDFYSSRNLVDEMIQFLDEEERQDAPFFSYLSFQAIHIPVQVPKRYTEKYLEVYKNGWKDIRDKRFTKAKELNLIPKDAVLGKMLPDLRNWDQLDEEERRYLTKAMAVNAGMLESMDEHIGRYIEFLKKQGKYDNTVFIITSDNSYNSSGPEWAGAAASPSAFFKFYAGEGGLRVPLIFSGKGVPQSQATAFSMVTDVTPTILSLAGIHTPKQLSIGPMTGRTLYPLLRGDTTDIYGVDEPIGIEAAGHGALFKGDYKLVRNGRPYGDGIWRLYNLKHDPGEIIDLAKSEPRRFAEMILDYDDYTEKYGVLEMGVHYEPLLEIQNKLAAQIMSAARPWFLGIGAFLIGFILYRKFK